MQEPLRILVSVIGHSRAIFLLLNLQTSLVHGFLFVFWMKSLGGGAVRRIFPKAAWHCSDHALT
jgi:hypothetical protein